MANSVRKSDFYYGAFLTKAIQKGNKLALISKSSIRGIYRLITDKDDYVVYIKYSSNKKHNNRRWSFNFTDNNIEEIRTYMRRKENIIFCFICAYDDLNNCEVAVSSLEELKECINPDCKINKDSVVRIYKKKYSPVLRMYGTARSDKKSGKDNTIHLERNRINNL